MPGKKEVLMWYLRFCEQMRKDYGVDLAKRTDAMRFASVKEDAETGGYRLDRTFLRHKPDGSYTAEEPEYPSADDVAALAMQHNQAVAPPASEDPTRAAEQTEAALHDVDRRARELFRPHAEWMLQNQQIFNTAAEDDYGQILRIYEDAHAGRLMLYDNTGDLSKSRMVLVNDDGTVQLEGSVSEPEPGFRIADESGALIEADPDTVLNNFNMGMQPLPEDGAPRYRLTGQINARVRWVAEQLPELKPETAEEKALRTELANGSLQEQKPAAVKAPGFLSVLKVIFTLGISNDFKRYRTYQNDLTAWETRMTDAKAAKDHYEENLGKIKEKLIQNENRYPGIRDPKRKAENFRNRERLSAAFLFSNRGQAERYRTEWESRPHPEGTEKLFTEDFSTVLNKADELVLNTVLQRPECYDEYGLPTAEGKRYLRFLNLSLEEQKAEREKQEAEERKRAGSPESETGRLDRSRKLALDGLLDTTVKGKEFCTKEEIAPRVALLMACHMLDRNRKTEGYRAPITEDSITNAANAIAGDAAFRELVDTRSPSVLAKPLILLQQGYSAAERKEKLSEEMEKLFKSYSDVKARLQLEEEQRKNARSMQEGGKTAQKGVERSN